MSEAKPSKSSAFVFSLSHLLALTAIIAVAVAFILAYLKNHSLSRQYRDLVSISGDLKVTKDDQLASAFMPQVADGFLSWQVHVPTTKEYVLNLGVGLFAENAIPPIVGTAILSSGRHRVTLYTGDSLKEEFNFVVYVDGKSLIEKKMGRDWLSNGWSSSHSVNWPRRWKGAPAQLQLEGKTYEPRRDFGPNNYFNGQSDNSVTRLGYRLWICQADMNYPPPSPFVGLEGDYEFEGIGLGDGLRLKTISSNYQWKFTRPSLQSSDQLLCMEAEFTSRDGSTLSSQIQPTPNWEIRNDAIGSVVRTWSDNPSLTTQTVFLHAKSNSQNELRPVVEMRWDTNRPDEFGLRLADTPANDSIYRWRLRIKGGDYHLWRMLKVGEQMWITPEDLRAKHAADAEASTNQSLGLTSVSVPNVSPDDYHLRWQTNEDLPLQIVERVNKSYSNMALYQGLPTTFQMHIPNKMNPTVAADIQGKHPQSVNTSFPNGQIFESLQIDLQNTSHDWIWISAKLKD